MTRAKIIAGKAVIVIEAHNLVDKVLGKLQMRLQQLANRLNRMGGALSRGGILGAIGSGLMLRQYAKFDDAMLELRVKLGYLDKLTIAQVRTMKTLEGRIRSLGRTTSYTSQQIASAAIELAKGGLNPTEIMNALRAVLDLGRGTKATLDEAGRLYVRTMRTFGIGSEKATEVVSQFVRATRFGTLNIEDLELALRYSSGTAATLEQNLAPILAIFAELSNKGLAGSIGGTSLNTAMANLVKKMQDIGAAYPGFRAIYKDGSLDLLQTFRELFKITSKMPAVEQIQVFQDIFNLRGSRAVAGIRDINNILKMADAISKAGNEARKAAEIMDSGPGGRGRMFLSAMQDLILTLGKASDTYLVPLLNIMRNLINELNKLTAMNPKLAALVVFSPAILLGSGLAMLTLGKAIGSVAASLGLLLTVGRPAASLLTKGIGAQIGALAYAGTRGKESLFGGGPKAKTGLLSGAKIGAGFTAFHKKLSTMGPVMRNITKLATSTLFVITNIIAPSTGVGIKGNLTARALLSIKTSVKSLWRSMRMWQSAGGFYKVLMGGSARVGALMANPSKMFGKSGKALAVFGRYYAIFMRAFAAGNLRTMFNPRNFMMTMGAFKGTMLLNLAKGLGSLAKNLLFVAKIGGRFLFSWNGVFVALELLFTFTTLGPRILGAIGNSLRALFGIIQLGSGPWKLFMTSLKAIGQGRTQAGIYGMKVAFMDMAAIIGNQLVAAWNRFKEAMGPFFDTIKAIAVTIVATIETIFVALKGTITRTFQAIGTQMNTIGGGLFGSEGSLAGTAKSIGLFVAKGIPTLITWLAKLQIILTGFISKLAIELEHTLGIIFTRYTPGILNRQSRIDQIELRRGIQLQNEEGRTAVELLKLDRNLEKQSMAIEKAFNANASKEGNQGALAARRRSEMRSLRSSNLADQISRLMQASVAKAITSPPPGNGQRGNSTAVNLAEAKKVSRLAASALVTSARGSVGNLAKVGKPVEEQQLAVMKEIRDNQLKDLNDKGLRLKK